jgi:hypothetical protein
MPNSQINNEFVYTISKDEIQMFAEHFKNRELTPSEMESFEFRINKHISCEHIVGAIEDCLAEILE